MKILHIITNLDTGGAEMMLYKLISENHSYPVSDHLVISMQGKGTIGPKIEKLGVMVLPLKITGYNVYSLLAGFISLIRYIRFFKPDILQGWMYHGNIVAYIGRFFCSDSKVIWNIRHSLYDINREKPITRFLINIGAMLSSRVSGIIYNSKISACQHNEYGYDSSKNCIIPNGFQLDLFKQDNDKRYFFRKSIGIHDDIFVIGNAARYHAMKDHATLIEAASLLISSGYKVKFLLAGRGVDSDNETLVSIINACALKEHVYLLGEVDDMVSFLNSLDVFCLSSIFGEGFPNVLGEAMSCGVPCVSTDVGDAKYIIGDTGLIVPHSSTYEMTEAFKQIITQVRDFRSVMQVNSKNRISENYSIHSSFEKYNQFYDAVYLG